MPGKPYTAKEIEYIIANRATMHDKEIARALGRPYRGVKHLCARKRIIKNPRMTQEEKDFIINNHKILTAPEISIHLKRTVSSVRNFVWRLKQESLMHKNF